MPHGSGDQLIEPIGNSFVSQEITFPNNHFWSPQAAADWDFPWTPEEIEPPPLEWTPKESWEPEVGYPWQRPRRRCGTDCDPYNPSVCLRPYMHQWDPSGELDWLCDFRKLGGFPITLAFVADSSRSKLIADRLAAIKDQQSGLRWRCLAARLALRRHRRRRARPVGQLPASGG